MPMKAILDIIYMVSSIGGAAVVAANIGAQVLGYTLFLISSVTALILLLSSNASRSLVVVNSIFTVINVVGLIRA